MDKTAWHGRDGELSLEEITALERTLDIKFPKEYIEVVMNNDGAYPDEHDFFMNDRGEYFNNLISLGSNPKYNIFETLESVSDRWVNGIFPFGEDPFGNLICFDYRTSENPTIVFWDHEIAGGGDLEGALTLICDTFTDFLNMLHEAPEE